VTCRGTRTAINSHHQTLSAQLIADPVRDISCRSPQIQPAKELGLSGINLMIFLNNTHNKLLYFAYNLWRRRWRIDPKLLVHLALDHV